MDATEVPPSGGTSSGNVPLFEASGTSGGSTIEAQQMVRRVKTYTIVDSEFNSLAATTIAANLLLVVATLFFSVGVDCLISKMAISPDVHTSASQDAFFYWLMRLSFGAGTVFFLLTVIAWIFGWSIFYHVKKTSREGKIIAG